MINNKNLTEKQIKRLEEIRVEVAMNMFEWFNNEQEPCDIGLHSEICDHGGEMVALLKLYKEQLKEEGKLPLSHFKGEMENINIVVDGIEEAIMDLMEKGTCVTKKYSNTGEDKFS
jgi:hypothetical protein